MLCGMSLLCFSPARPTDRFKCGHAVINRVAGVCGSVSVTVFRIGRHAQENGLTSFINDHSNNGERSRRSHFPSSSSKGKDDFQVALTLPPLCLSSIQ
jgi:hypothetical protein